MDTNKHDQTPGAQQGNIDNERDSTADANKPAETEKTNAGFLSDKGDMGKEGSMKESFKDKQGYRTMDEDENEEDSLKKGDDESTMGNP